MKTTARVRDLEMMIDLTLSVMVRHLTDPATVTRDLRTLAEQAHTPAEASQYTRLADELDIRINQHTEIKREVLAICASPRVTHEVLQNG